MALERKMIFSLIFSWEFVRMVPTIIMVLVKSARTKNLKQGGYNRESRNDKRVS